MPYAPLYKTLNSLSAYRSPYSIGKQQQRGPSAYEQELLPHIQEASAKKERRRKWLQPIQVVFDILSRGQYMTANVAKQITRNLREGKPALEGIPREAWQGLSGKEKGDWSTVLWGGEDKGGEQFQGWGQKWGEKLEKSWGGRRLKGGLALAGNILLDPTTYIGFGPATGARKAAAEVTEDAVKIATKRLAAEVGEKAAGIGAKRVGELAFKNADEARRVLGKALGRDVDREISEIIKQVRKAAIRKPAAQLRKEMLGQAEDVARRIEGSTLDLMGKQGAPLAKQLDVVAGETEGLKDLSELIQKLKTGKDVYKGAGTRAMRFMRKEFAVGERYPAVIKAWDKAGEWMAQSKVGGMFNDAWWALMNTSPVAALKKAFNIRTPYEQYLANLQLDKMAMGPYLREDYARNYFKATKGLKPEEKVVLRDTWTSLQGGQETDNILDLLMQRGLKPDRAAEAQKAYTQVRSTFKTYDDWYRKKFSQDPTLFSGQDEMGWIANYLPMATKRTDVQLFRRAKSFAGPRAEGFTKARTTDFGEMMDLEKRVWRMMEPRLTDEQIGKLVGEYNLNRYINLDLDEMILGRMFAQARMQQNVALIEQFRELGVNIKDITKADDTLSYALQNNFTDFGLSSVKDARLEGYLFDPAVGDILTRSLAVTQNDPAIKEFEKYLSQFTSWWKGWATLSPGFHFRNYFSNMVTGFLKHGTEWLNPDTQFRSGVATLYGLYGDDAFKNFAKMGLSEDAARQMLGQKIGDYTLGELAELARQRGIITRATMGFDAPRAMEDFTQQANWNPLSTRFAPMKASRDIGTVIESQPRFLSFLLDVRRSANQGVASDAALDWAGWEAKKWFIDYTDLSPFEQKVMKNVIPFYSWTRKNLSNQIVGMMEFKEMYSLIPKVQAGGPEVEGMPDYMQNVGYFPIKQLIGDKAGMMQMLWPNLPYMDINKIPLKFEISDAGIPIPKFEGKEILNDVLSSAHPVLKTMFEIVPEEGWDVYYRKPLGETGEAPRLLSKLSRVAASNPAVLQFLDGFLVNIGVEEGLNGSIDDKGRLMINAKLARVLDNNLPFLQKLNQYMELPEYLTEAVRSARVKTADEKDPVLRSEKGLRVLSFYLGVKMKNLDEEAELGKQGDEILREAEEALRKERKGKPGYQQARLRYVQQRLLRKRRLGL